MTEEENASPRDEGPLPSLQEVLACQVNEWYPAFAGDHDDQPTVAENGEDGDQPTPQPPKRSRRRTIPTILIPLPDNFVAFLRQEHHTSAGGLRLPRDAKTSSTLWRNSRGNDVDGSDGWSSDSDDDNAAYDTSHRVPSAEGAPGDSDCAFPELDLQIEDAIRRLGGTVVPKLNWSVPRDATSWMSLNGSLACRFPGDVYLLLQSSDFVAYDLDHALIDVQLDVEPATTSPSPASPRHTYYLALRKWCNLYPSQEFRCFVRNHRLVAVSQRHHSQHFPHLKGDKERLKQLLRIFFEECVRHQYARGRISRYVWDAYVDTRDRVWLVDFNAWGRRTDPLLFAWDELERLGEGDVSADNGDSESEDCDAQVELRVVETANEVHGDPLASYRAPIDAIHVASLAGGTSGVNFEAFRKLCVAPSELDNRSDGDDED